MYLTIIIPMYNEACVITSTLERLHDTVMPDFVIQTEVIIVDDCSTDNSADLAEKICLGWPGTRVIRLPLNSGKGSAVAAGVREAKNDTVIVQDADLELDPGDIPALLRKMHSENLDFVSGTRFSTRTKYPGHAVTAITLNRLLSAFASWMTGRKITDLTCGYKLIRKELFEKLELREKRFGFETELMFKALHDSTTTFAEEPVSYYPRRKSEGKKISISDGFGIAAKVLKFSLSGKKWLSILTMTLIIAFMTVTMLREKLWKDEQRVIEWDAISYYAYLPAAFIYHDLSLSFADNYKGPHKFIVWPERGPEGKYVIKTSMGLSLLWSPFFLAGHAAASVSGADTGGYSPPYKFSLLAAALMFLTMGLIFLRKILLECASDAVTAMVIAAFVIATNLYWYTLYQGTMSHVYSFTLISAFVWYSMKWHRAKNDERMARGEDLSAQSKKFMARGEELSAQSKKFMARGEDLSAQNDEFMARGKSLVTQQPGNKLWHAVRLGLLFGFISLIRPTNVIILIFFLLYGVTSAETLRRRLRELTEDYRHMILIALVASAVWVPQLIYWKEMTGNWFYFSYGSDERFFFADPAIIKGLFSWRKGLFIYTPLMIFTFAGIITLWIRRSAHALPVTLFVPLNIYIIFSWWCWWYGGGFGQRAFIDSYALMAVATAYLLSLALATGKRWLRTSIIIAFILLASMGVVNNIQYYNGAIHWDSMTKEAYFDSFGRLRPSARFNELLESPDYDGAREGSDR